MCARAQPWSRYCYQKVHPYEEIPIGIYMHLKYVYDTFKNG